MKSLLALSPFQYTVCFMHLSLLYTLFSTHSKRRITQEIQEEGQQPTNIPKEENTALEVAFASDEELLRVYEVSEFSRQLLMELVGRPPRDL